MKTTMRVVDHGQGGAPEIMKIISDAPLPVIKPHEVLIEVHATGINRPDVFQRSGSYPPPLGASPYLGLEVAGVVVALGSEVTQWQIGDQVCALTPGGAYAEYCATPAAHCLRIPKGLSMVQAAAIPETYFTVWSNLFDMGHLQSGETLLVHGGSSGIGVTAIQFAKAFGAKVITTVGSNKKAQRCLELGADVTIEYKDQDYEEVILKLTNKVGVNVILDIVGGPYIQKNINCLAIDGRLLQVAFLKGSRAELDVNAIMRKRLTYTGATMRPRSDAQKAAIAQQLEKHIWPLLDAGKCLPVIDTVFPLTEVVAAHQLMESSVHIGKIVLEVKTA
jgi:putative PIG3 family NAD(P)H quinone oxidoreductase